MNFLANRIRLLALAFAPAFFGSLGPLNACDLCGCASGSSGLGVLPRFDSGFLGLRYAYQGFGHLNKNIPGVDNALSDDFHRLELWSRIPLNERLQLIVTLPYALNRRSGTLTTTRLQGIGDAQLLVNGWLWRKESEKNSFQLNAAAGLRLPTGKYRQRDESGMLLPIGLQTGTGTYGLPMALQSGWRRGSWGAMAELFALWNTENEETYKPGSQYSAALLGLYYGDFKQSFLVAHAGLRYEQSGMDSEFGQTLNQTGYDRISVQAGADFYRDSWMLGWRAALPMAEWAPEGQADWNGMMSVQLLWFWPLKNREKGEKI